MEVGFPSFVDGAAIQKLITDLGEFLGDQPLRGAILDASSVERFSADIRVPGRELLEFLVARGVRRPVAVVTRASVRMIGSAIAFAAGVPIAFVESRSDALAEIRGQKQAS